MSEERRGEGRDLRVRVSLGFGVSGLEHFTPGSSSRSGRCVFDINPSDGGDCDFWVVFGNSRPRETARVARANTLLAVGEPPAKKLYPKRYYRQFGHVADTHDGSGHPGLTVGPCCLPWMVGLSWKRRGYVYGHDHLKVLAPPVKENRVGVVCSSTAKTEGQRRRLEFLARMKERLGDRIVHFGKGFTPVDDKMEAVSPHRFHLVLENSRSPHYWTEKLTDAYLGWSHPLYVGCPNLADYFGRESFTPLDMDDVDGAVRTVEALLASERTEAEVEALRVARERVLGEYNPFNRFARWVERFHREASAETVELCSPKFFKPWTGWWHRMRTGRRSGG
jgi:hypothetical protein